MSTGALRLVIVPLAALSSIIGNGLVMHSVGLATFGVVSLIITLPNLVPFMDLGLGTSLINAFSTRGREEASAQAKVAWSMLWAVAILLFVTCVAIELTIGWGPLLGVDMSHFRPWGLIVFFAMTFISVPLGIGQRILTGLDHVPLVTTLGVISPLVNLPVLALGSWLGAPELFLFASSAGQMCVAGAMIIAATRKAGLRFSHWTTFTFGDRVMRREIASAASSMVVITAGLPLAFETHRLVLARLAPDQLGPYSVAMVLYSPVLGIAVQMAANLWPYFNGVRARAGERGATDKFWRLQGLGIAAACVYVCGFMVCAPFVNRLWSHRDLDPRIWVALGVLMLMQIVQYVPGMFLTSPRGLRFQAACIVGMCGMTLILMLALTRSTGAIGPIMASTIGIFLAQLVPEWAYIRSNARRLAVPRRGIAE